MWVDGRWIPKDLFGQLILLWLVMVFIAGLLLWRLARNAKQRCGANSAGKNLRRRRARR